MTHRSRSRAALPWLAGVLVLSGLLHGVPVSAAACPGDCNGNGSVTVDELVTGVNIALENASLSACPATDTSGDGMVTVNELVAAVSNALNGCPQIDTPTPTATERQPTVTATATPTVAGPVPIPTTARELLAWLQAGNYLSWTAESAPHASAGPHGGKVRTFLNDTVLDSLSAGNASHPAGSALVKELYFGGDTVALWAVSVKVQDDSAGGRGWYWWEGVGLAGLGQPACTGCHAAGRDYVRTPFPLQ